MADDGDTPPPGKKKKVPPKPKTATPKRKPTTATPPTPPRAQRPPQPVQSPVHSVRQQPSRLAKDRHPLARSPCRLQLGAASEQSSTDDDRLVMDELALAARQRDTSADDEPLPAADVAVHTTTSQLPVESLQSELTRALDDSDDDLHTESVNAAMARALDADAAAAAAARKKTPVVAAPAVPVQTPQPSPVPVSHLTRTLQSLGRLKGHIIPSSPETPILGIPKTTAPPVPSTATPVTTTTAAVATPVTTTTATVAEPVPTTTTPAQLATALAAVSQVNLPRAPPPPPLSIEQIMGVMVPAPLSAGDTIHTPAELEAIRLAQLCPPVAPVTLPPSEQPDELSERDNVVPPTVAMDEEELPVQDDPYRALANFSRQVNYIEDDTTADDQAADTPAFLMHKFNGYNVPQLRGTAAQIKEQIMQWIGKNVDFDWAHMEERTEFRHILPGKEQPLEIRLVAVPLMRRWQDAVAYMCKSQIIPGVYNATTHVYDVKRTIDIKTQIAECIEATHLTDRHLTVFQYMSPQRTVRFFTTADPLERAQLVEGQVLQQCRAYIQTNYSALPVALRSHSLTQSFHVATMEAMMYAALHDQADTTGLDFPRAYNTMLTSLQEIWPTLSGRVLHFMQTMVELQRMSPFTPSAPPKRHGLQHHHTPHQIPTPADKRQATATFAEVYQQLARAFDAMIRTTAYPDSIVKGLTVMFDGSTAFMQAQSNMALSPDPHRVKAVKALIAEMTYIGTPQAPPPVQHQHAQLTMQRHCGFVSYGLDVPLTHLTPADAVQFDNIRHAAAAVDAVVEQKIYTFHSDPDISHTSRWTTHPREVGENEFIASTLASIDPNALAPDRELAEVFVPTAAQIDNMTANDILPHSRVVVDGKTVMDYLSPTHRLEQPFPVGSPVPMAMVRAVPPMIDFHVNVAGCAQQIYIPPYSDEVAEAVLVDRYRVPEFQHGDANTTPFSPTADALLQHALTRLHTYVDTARALTPPGATTDVQVELPQTLIDIDELRSLWAGTRTANSTIPLAEALRLLHAKKGARPGNVTMQVQFHYSTHAYMAVGDFLKRFFVDKVAGISCDVLMLTKGALTEGVYKHRQTMPLSYQGGNTECWAAYLIYLVGYLPMCFADLLADESGKKRFYVLKTISFALKSGFVYQVAYPHYMQHDAQGYVSLLKPFTALLNMDPSEAFSRGARLIAADYKMLDTAFVHTFGHHVGNLVFNIADVLADHCKINPVLGVDENGQPETSYAPASITLLSALFLHHSIHYKRQRRPTRMLCEALDAEPKPHHSRLYNETMHMQPLPRLFSTGPMETFDINSPIDMSNMHETAMMAVAAVDVFQIACATTTLFREPDMSPIKQAVHCVLADFDFPTAPLARPIDAYHPFARIPQHMVYSRQLPTSANVRDHPFMDAYALMFHYLRRIMLNSARVAEQYNVRQGTQIFQSIIVKATEYMTHQTTAVLMATTAKGTATPDPVWLPYAVQDIVYIFREKLRSIFPSARQYPALLSVISRDWVEATTSYRVPAPETADAAHKLYQALNMQLDNIVPPPVPLLIAASTPRQWYGYQLRQTIEHPHWAELLAAANAVNFAVPQRPPTDEIDNDGLDHYTFGLKLLAMLFLRTHLVDQQYLVDTLHQYVDNWAIPDVSTADSLMPPYAGLYAANATSPYWFAGAFPDTPIACMPDDLRAMARKRWQQMTPVVRKAIWRDCFETYRAMTDTNEVTRGRPQAALQEASRWLGRGPDDDWERHIHLLYVLCDPTSELSPLYFRGLCRPLTRDTLNDATLMTRDWYIRLNDDQAEELQSDKRDWRYDTVEWATLVVDPMRRYLRYVRDDDPYYRNVMRGRKADKYKDKIKMLRLCRKSIKSIVLPELASVPLFREEHVPFLAALAYHSTDDDVLAWLKTVTNSITWPMEAPSHDLQLLVPPIRDFARRMWTTIKPPTATVADTEPPAPPEETVREYENVTRLFNSRMMPLGRQTPYTVRASEIDNITRMTERQMVEAAIQRLKDWVFDQAHPYQDQCAMMTLAGLDMTQSKVRCAFALHRAAEATTVFHAQPLKIRPIVAVSTSTSTQTPNYPPGDVPVAPEFHDQTLWALPHDHYPPQPHTVKHGRESRSVQAAPYRLPRGAFISRAENPIKDILSHTPDTQPVGLPDETTPVPGMIQGAPLLNTALMDLAELWRAYGIPDHHNPFLGLAVLQKFPAVPSQYAYCDVNRERRVLETPDIRGTTTPSGEKGDKTQLISDAKRLLNMMSYASQDPQLLPLVYTKPLPWWVSAVSTLELDLPYNDVDTEALKARRADFAQLQVNSEAFWADNNHLVPDAFRRPLPPKQPNPFPDVKVAPVPPSADRPSTSAQTSQPPPQKPTAAKDKASAQSTASATADAATSTAPTQAAAADGQQVPPSVPTPPPAASTTMREPTRAPPTMLPRPRSSSQRKAQKRMYSCRDPEPTAPTQQPTEPPAAAGDAAPQSTAPPTSSADTGPAMDTDQPTTEQQPQQEQAEQQEDETPEPPPGKRAKDSHTAEVIELCDLVQQHRPTDAVPPPLATRVNSTTRLPMHFIRARYIVPAQDVPRYDWESRTPHPPEGRTTATLHNPNRPQTTAPALRPDRTVIAIMPGKAHIYDPGSPDMRAWCEDALMRAFRARRQTEDSLPRPKAPTALCYYYYTTDEHVLIVTNKACVRCLTVGHAVTDELRCHRAIRRMAEYDIAYCRALGLQPPIRSANANPFNRPYNLCAGPVVLDTMLSGLTEYEIDVQPFMFHDIGYTTQCPPIFWIELMLPRAITIVTSSGMIERHRRLYMTSMGALWFTPTVQLDSVSDEIPGMSAAEYQFFHETILCTTYRINEPRDTRPEWDAYSQKTRFPQPYAQRPSTRLYDVDYEHQRCVNAYYRNMHKQALDNGLWEADMQWWDAATCYYLSPKTMYDKRQFGRTQTEQRKRPPRRTSTPAYGQSERSKTTPGATEPSTTAPDTQTTAPPKTPAPSKTAEPAPSTTHQQPSSDKAKTSAKSTPPEPKKPRKKTDDSAAAGYGAKTSHESRSQTSSRRQSSQHSRSRSSRTPHTTSQARSHSRSSPPTTSTPVRKSPPKTSKTAGSQPASSRSHHRHDTGEREKSPEASTTHRQPRKDTRSSGKTFPRKSTGRSVSTSQRRTTLMPHLPWHKHTPPPPARSTFRGRPWSDEQWKRHYGPRQQTDKEAVAEIHRRSRDDHQHGMAMVQAGLTTYETPATSPTRGEPTEADRWAGNTEGDRHRHATKLAIDAERAEEAAKKGKKTADGAPLPPHASGRPQTPTPADLADASSDEDDAAQRQADVAKWAAQTAEVSSDSNVDRDCSPPSSAPPSPTPLKQKSTQPEDK